MMSISFKAEVQGVNSKAKEANFKILTNKDKEHKMVFIRNQNEFEDDCFELYKNGEKTAEYKTKVLNEKLLSIQRLLGIYNILKKLETDNQK